MQSTGSQLSCNHHQAATSLHLPFTLKALHLYHTTAPPPTPPKLLASSMELEAVKKPSTLKTDWGRTVFFFFVLYCLSLFHSLPTADLHRQNPKHIFLCGNGYKKHLMSSKLSIDLIQIKCPIN